MMNEVQPLETLDYTILIVYVLGIVALGVYLGKGMKTGRDYFLAGRQLPWWAIGMSMVVTDIGAVEVVGLAGSAYVYGLVVANFDWIGCVPVMIVGGLVFVARFWRAGVYTVPEYLSKRFNGVVGGIEAAIWGLYLPCYVGIMLYATAKMSHVLLGWDTVTSIVFFAVVTGLYTLVGGLAAVVYTDVVQCVILVAGCAAACVLGLFRVGGIDGLVESVHALGADYENHFDLILPGDTSSPYPWSGVLFGLGFVLAPAYWIGNQSIVQRTFGARSEFEAKAAFVWGALLKTLIPLLLVVPGIIALAHGPGLEDSDLAVPSLVADVLPTGFLGLFFAAFLAAFMSSVDSSLNSTATLWVNDVYRRFLCRRGSERHYLLVGRIVTVVGVLWGIGFALWANRAGAQGIFEIFQALLTLFQGPTLAIILLGVLWPRATGAGALCGLLGGLGLALSLMLVNKYASQPVFAIQDPFLYIAWWSFCAALAVTAAVSLVTKPRKADMEGAQV